MFHLVRLKTGGKLFEIAGGNEDVPGCGTWMFHSLLRVLKGVEEREEREEDYKDLR